MSNVSIVGSDKWGHGFGIVPKLDGTPPQDRKGAFGITYMLSGHNAVDMVNQSWSCVIMQVYSQIQ